ncbi:MAG: Fpg/Nei family DNA glycosylase [Thermoleophilia bacterium]|nr:Fpg/Nei family DNA glycosylase [Thermoleophilia bacterium]
MPEGDTVHRVARVLSAELTGQTLSEIKLHDRGEVPELVGCTIESVEAAGKHLLVNFSGDWTLRVHLGMHGRWLRKHVREPRPKDWTVIITTGEVAYVCRRSYRAELVRTSALHAHPRLARLGPDLLADPPLIDEMVRRARLPGHAEREMGDVLLDQRVASGIGNVYKSEVLFEVRVHPRTKVRELSDAQLTRIFETAAALMRPNLLTRRRTTVPLPRRGQPSSERLWVYGRAGKPCLECGTPIERFGQGDMARTTYFCPRCQASGT